jgi:hypothetical protein
MKSSVTLASVGSKTQSIVRVGECFVLRDGGRELSMRPVEVICVDGTKVDKVTYEENFLVLTTTDGSKLAIGELADGFSEFEQAISTSLVGFPSQWRVAVERRPAEEYVTLWARQSSA